MKTDKFDDSIRRKLESIEPAFREKDWSQMQSYMHQHAPSTALPVVTRWLLPSSAAAAIVALLVTTVWQYRTNQELRQSVSSLNKTITNMRELQTGTSPQSRTDTVYITKYVPVPAPATQNASDAYAKTDTQSEDELATGTDQSDALTQETDPNEQTTQPQGQPNRRRTYSGDNIDIARTSPAGTSGLPNAGAPPATETNNPAHPVADKPVNSVVTDVSSAGATNRNGSRLSPNEPADIAGITGQTNRTNGANNRADRLTRPNSGSARRDGGVYDRTDVAKAANGRPSGTIPQTGIPELTSQSGSTADAAWLNVEPMNSRGLGADSAYYSERLDRRSRKIRSLLPVPQYTPAQAEALASEPSSPVKLRLGAATNLSSSQRGAGLYSEVLFGKHVTLGIGINRLTIAGGKFLTDIDFNKNKKRDFRRDYANGIDPRHEILNIDQRSITWQLPVSLGYRIPLVNNLAITPSASLNFSLNAKETISFTYRRAPGDFNVRQMHAARPTDWFNSWTLAVAAEKQWKNWIIQASPYYSKPFMKTPFNLTSSATGLRVRVLYQF